MNNESPINDNEYYEPPKLRGRPRTNAISPSHYVKDGETKVRDNSKSRRSKARKLYEEYLRTRTSETIRSEQAIYQRRVITGTKDAPNAIRSLRGIDIDWDKIERENRYYERKMRENNLPHGCEDGQK